MNHRITAKEVRVVGEGIVSAVYPVAEAIKMAEDMEMDLVEISPSATPPVCKIIDYKKFLYDQKKKQKEIKAKTVKTVIKELRFGPNTDDHDFAFKLKHAINFIEENAKIKAYVFFKGRSIMFSEQGREVLARLAKELDEIAVVESMPKLEGKRMIMMLAPKKKK
ncbi:MAG: translation initiation factor IF-3 [Flavobacteriales bacterium]|nr:translation initiation factor IF-3 [Flavobacteriales bacterium]